MTTPCSRTAVEVAERFADGLASEQDRFAAFAVAIQKANGWANCCGALDAAYSAGVSAAAFAAAEAETVADAGNAVVMAEVNFPNFMRTPVLISAFDASGGAGAAVGAWVEVNQDDALEEHSSGWERTVFAAGASRAVGIGLRTIKPETDWLGEQEKAQAREQEIQCDLLRDIFGNPFRPVAFSASWRTDAVVSLARQMYESRDFGAMPILADALQDAGCDNDDILNHCRAPGEHVRGCWVVDLVLGKE
ncbi:hypothetical protein [Gemmata massiliana]|nr:hypothetical protein [Gemmata massiliana]